MDLSTFLVVLFSFTGAAVIVIGAVVLAIGRGRHQGATLHPGQLSAEELGDLQARLAELEQRGGRLEEVEERLDFADRVLGRPRKANPLRNPSEA